MQQRQIDIATTDGAMDTYIACPDGAGSWPVVILLMDGLGVRPVLRAMADRLAGEGYYVLLPNLYYRAGPAGNFDPVADLPRVPALIQSIVADRVAAECGVLLDFAATQPQARTTVAGCVGYCMGGGLSLGVAARLGARIGAAACIHGAAVATDMPDSPHRLAAQLRARVYVAVAQIDPWLTPGETERLERALAEAGVDHELELYAGVQHGFAVADLPAAFDVEACEHHWRRVLALFAGTLG